MIRNRWVLGVLGTVGALAALGAVNGVFQNITASGTITAAGINNTPIGATTPSTGAFTSLSTTAAAVFGGVASAPTFQGPLTGNATTATQLQNTPTNCTSSGSAYGISANGNALCNVLTSSLGTNGYTTLPNGLIIQWMTGATTLSAASRQNFTESWPIPFPNHCFVVEVSVKTDNTVSTNNDGYAIYVNPGTNLSSVNMFSDVGADGVGDSTHRVFMVGIGN